MQPDWVQLGGLLMTLAGSLCGVYAFLDRRIALGDKAVRSDIEEVEKRLAAMIGKSDFDMERFKTEVKEEFVRNSVYEVSNSNTDRRLDSIEGKIDRQTDILLSALSVRGTPRGPSK